MQVDWLPYPPLFSSRVSVTRNRSYHHRKRIYDNWGAELLCVVLVPQQKPQATHKLFERQRQRQQRSRAREGPPYVRAATSAKGPIAQVTGISELYILSRFVFCFVHTNQDCVGHVPLGRVEIFNPFTTRLVALHSAHWQVDLFL